MPEIRRLMSDAEARACATMMSSSEPWLTLGRTLQECLALLVDPTREVYVAAEDGAVRGFIIINMHGAFSGYIQTICVDPGSRGSGLGSQLVAFAEERIFRDSPNVFLCVPSFNPRARSLYERLGYETIGEIRDFLVRGHSEVLMRKTIGPMREFRKR
ncbi:MAG: GNAT family N-acetyltransferase [Thermoanaerobaculia bacterium]